MSESMPVLISFQKTSHKVADKWKCSLNRESPSMSSINIQIFWRKHMIDPSSLKTCIHFCIDFPIIYFPVWMGYCGFFVLIEEWYAAYSRGGCGKFKFSGPLYLLENMYCRTDLHGGCSFDCWVPTTGWSHNSGY